MFKPGNPILFATDLSPKCKPALDCAIVMGIRFQSPVYILHVVEHMPETYEGHLKGLLGTHKWEDLISSQQEEVHKSLLGKKHTSHIIHEKLQDFCESAGNSTKDIDLETCEIIIRSGEISEEILKAAEEKNCGLIVVASADGFIARNSLGKTIKTIATKSAIPVTIVPATELA